MSESRPLVNSSSASSAVSNHGSSSASSVASSQRPLLPSTCAVPVFTARSRHERPPAYPSTSVEFLQRRRRDQSGEALPAGGGRRASALAVADKKGRKWMVAQPPPPLHQRRSCSAHSHSHPTCWFQPSSGDGGDRDHQSLQASAKPPQRSRSPVQGQRAGDAVGRAWPSSIARKKAPPSLFATQRITAESPDVVDDDVKVVYDGDGGGENEVSPVYKTTSRKGQKLARREQGPLEYGSWKELCLDFCARTSSHGVPFVGTHSFFGRIVWGFITVVAFLAVSIQTYYTLSDYFEYRTIIEMQLRFEPAPFPAATVCNLNSFKFSELKKFEELAQGFQLWERAIATLKAAEQEQNEGRTRKRRQVTYQAVYVKCVCNLGVRDQCVPTLNELDLNASVCLCFQDAKTGDIWPCYAKSVWHEKKCYHCSHSHTCDDPDQPNVTSMLTEALERDCLCQSVSHYCIERSSNDTISWWNPHNYTSFPATEPPTASAEVEEAFGLEDLKDRGAITTKTKENLIFMVAQMPRETRRQLSYTLDEFVLRCSFNSKDCDMRRDFQIQIDPEYGNCFTFNFNDSVELKNSRAGPMYGLRLLLNVNQSDYMPTTEAAGVRLVVHEQDQEPFPDTFGYSAPTGFISSFGLKTKMLHRLDSPYGKCSDTFRPEGYIYAEHYSPEGCYRNCFQHIILERCGCGDPRFPLPSSNQRPCDARNARQKACLANETSVLGGFHHLTHDCHCVQPCTENVFETAYSSAAWPATNFIIGAECTAMLETDNYTHETCTEYYRQNTAYIEIYYEQLNFESLNETAGYTLVNLFSDLGGNIGLWIGFSLITVLEFVELLLECIAYGGRRALYLDRNRRGHGGSGWRRGRRGRRTPPTLLSRLGSTEKQSSASMHPTEHYKNAGRRHGLVLAHYPYVGGDVGGDDQGRLVYSNDDYAKDDAVGDKEGGRRRRSILRTPSASIIDNRTRGGEGGNRGVRWREK